MKKNSLFLFIVAISCFFQACSTTNSRTGTYLLDSAQQFSEPNTIVNSEQGWLRGFRDDGTISWKGVRYAAAPLGSLRWQAPQAPAAWDGITDAHTPGKPAFQLAPVTDIPTGAEDCLTLNIWRPDDLATKLPIYIWVHGGANTAGDAAPNGDYSGQNLAKRSGMVVVSINYRLGPFGWLLDSSLVAKNTGGNFGLLDIMAALRWIKSNAKAFGGNPDNITLTGESAGAANILALLCMDEAVGLFQRAILQSPLNMTSSANLARAKSRDLLCSVLVKAKRARNPLEASEVLDSMSADEKSIFFRSVEADDFLGGFSGGIMGMYDWPSLILDGSLLPLKGLAVFSTGDHKVKVPLIIGSNRDEVGIFLFLEGKIRANNPIYHKALAYGSAAWRAEWIEAIASDLASDPEQAPVFMYRFDWGSSQSAGSNVLPAPLEANIGAFHALEIPFFLGNDTIAGYLLSKLVFNLWNTESRKTLTLAIMSYTRNFALGLDMEKPWPETTLPPWPRFIPLGVKNRGATGLIFTADSEAALITNLASSQSASEELAELEASISASEIHYIKSKLPLFMKNAWQPDNGPAEN